MAKDGISVKFRGGEKLDKALKQIANVKQSKASSIVYSSLGQGATQIKKSIKRDAPKMSKNETYAVFSGGRKIKITKGQLKKSVTSGVRRKAKVDRNTFLASVWLKDGRGGAKEGVDDGFFSHWILRGTRKGIKANDFVSSGVSKGESAFRNKVGSSLAKKIAAFGQQKINRL